MKPESSNPKESFDLPIPQEIYDYQWEPEAPAGEKDTAISIEKGASQPDPTTNIADPAASDPAPNSGAGSIPLSTSVSLTPLLADDSDLIEREWVEKAKEIVNQTRHDPYRQNKEINRMKADYLKMRYNKDIKLSEE